jgi:hypothetical protein
MAETVVQPNNKAVAFQGKPSRESRAPGIKAKAKKLHRRGMISAKELDKLTGLTEHDREQG